MGITSALLNQPFDTVTNGHCPTTDCRLPELTSLAVCSYCDTYQVTKDDFDICEYEMIEVPILEAPTEEDIGFGEEFVSDKELPVVEPPPEAFTKRQEGIPFTDRNRFIQLLNKGF